MKKMFAAAAMLLSVSMTQVSCKGGGTSEVGKWKVTDMTSPDMPADKVAEAKAGIASMNMTWEFTKDGKAIISAMGQSGPAGNYTRTGNTLEMTDGSSQKKEKMEISSITDDKMVIKPANGENMSVTMERVK